MIASWTPDGVSARLAAQDAAPRSDFDLDVHEEPDDAAALRPAAVLAPIVERPSGPTILLTVRSPKLKRHAGQIAFPGGRIDATDHSPLDAALREAEEEIGLARDRVEVLGRLPDYRTVTGFRVAPFVGLVRPNQPWRPDPAEVDDVFEAPLADLMDPSRHEVHAQPFRGAIRRYYAIPWRDRYIWGATAAMLVSLYETAFAKP